MDPNAGGAQGEPNTSPTSIPSSSFIHGTAAMDDDGSVSAGQGHDEHELELQDQEQEAFVDEAPQPRPKSPVKGGHSPKRRAKMTEADVDIFQRLDAEYDRAMEEREVAYAARYNSVRQSACFAIMFIATYMTLGTIYFMRQADWTVEESLFFGIYTITTVGYGNLDNPETPAFQIYTIFFILIGIATLTIMVAQVYQCIALEAGRVQHSRDQSEMMRRGLDIMASKNRGHSGDDSITSGASSMQQSLNAHFPVPLVDRCFRCFDRARTFFLQNELGRGLSVLLPFVALIVIGAAVVGIIEGWTIVESLYFAVVSLTTVGFGDYFPQKRASRFFCIIWLPFSVGFMSLFLGNIAAFYIRLSDRNIARIERHLKRRIVGLKERSEREREAARKRALRGQETSPRSEGDDGGMVVVDDETPTGFSAIPASEARRRRPTGPSLERRTRVMENYQHNNPKSSGGSDVKTMKDILKKVHSNMKSPSSQAYSAGPESEYLNLRSNRNLQKSLLLKKGDGSVRKPSFALRVLVQERLAEIIAMEVAGFQDEIAIQDYTLTVRIDTLKATAEKWLIPRRARRAFRAVAFEALYFVGEHGLITRGANALYALNPFEFHGLFAPLLAALGDADTMEGWMASTEVLAEYDLKKGGGGTGNTPAAPLVAVDIDNRGHGQPSPVEASDKMIV